MEGYPEYSGKRPIYNGEEIEIPEDIDMAVLWEVQNCELKILEELERICQKYGLHYSLAGGTLIGAVRHQDFVPWDDDIDIDMYHTDFEKLVEVLPHELGEDFDFVNYDEFGEYFCDFIPRIFYKKSETINSFSIDGTGKNIANDPRMNHIFIELYNLYDTKKGAVVKLQIFATKAIYGMAMAHRAQKKSTENYTPLQKLQTAVLGAIGKRIPLKTIYRMYEKNARLVKDGKGDALFKPSVPIHVLERNVFDKEWFSGYTHLEVRGKSVMVPKNYLAMLGVLYTNFRELPPVESRRPDHFNLSHVKIWE
jgi:lipopolysaccharide cholinephosphotransferase